MRALVLRLDAPLLAFGGVVVDAHGVIDRFPGTAMLTGLFGNALGWEHADAPSLQALQDRLQFAARWDLDPVEMVDYHTVDMGQPKMAEPGWTTRGKPEHRLGGTARFGTHQRYRHYWVDGLMTVAVTLDPPDADPGLAQVQAALRHPQRPLFLGRKACLPSRPLLDPVQPITEGNNLYEILAAIPVWDRSGRAVTRWGQRMACWPAEIEVGRSQVRRIYDLRDWANQLPVGSRMRREGFIREA